MERQSEDLVADGKFVNSGSELEDGAGDIPANDSRKLDWEKILHFAEFHDLRRMDGKEKSAAGIGIDDIRPVRLLGLGRAQINRRHVQQNVDTPELAMGFLDGADNLVFFGGIGSDCDCTHSLANRSSGGSFRRIARAAVDPREIASVQGEGVSDNLSNTRTAGKHRHFALWSMSLLRTLFLQDERRFFPAINPGNLGLDVQLFLGMNPGTPVSTTGLSLIRVLIPSLISLMASSGRVEI
jgi:hypothetical protein